MGKPRTGAGGGDGRASAGEGWRPKRVLAYARVSSLIQETHGTSLEGQRDEFTRFCRAHDYPAPIVYVETEGGGAEKLEKRAEMHRLLASVRAGDLVLCAKQDRWSRYTLFYLQSTEQIVRAGARFFSIAERFDPSTPEGKFAAATMANVAELEHARIRDRTIGSRRRLRMMGKYVEGPPPYGYTVDAKKRVLVVHEDRAEVIRTIFALCIEGYSTREIARRIGRTFGDVPGQDAAAIARRLRDRRYIGDLATVGRRGKRPGPDAEYMRGTHPAIIDAATWRRAQAALTARKASGRPPSAEARSAAFLLRGLVRCGDCGHVMASHAPGPDASIRHGGWYQCKRREGNADGRCVSGPRARHDELDALVDAAMVKRLGEVARALVAPSKAGVRRADAPDFDRRRDTLVKKRENVVGAIAEGTVSAATARSTIAKLEAEIEALEARRADYEARLPKAPTERSRREELATVKALAAAWSSLTVAERRTVIATHADVIEVSSVKGAKKWARNGTWAHRVVWRKLS